MSDVATNPYWPYEPNNTGTDEEIRTYLDPSGLIEWDTPAAIMRFTDDREHPFYACRLCIARHGLKGFNIKHLPQTVEAFEAHRKEHHAAA